MEELKTRYRVYKPSGLEILKTFMELEDRVEKGIKQDFTYLSQEHDLFGEAYIGMQLSPYLVAKLYKVLRDNYSSYQNQYGALHD